MHQVPESEYLSYCPCGVTFSTNWDLRCRNLSLVISIEVQTWIRHSCHKSFLLQKLQFHLLGLSPVVLSLHFVPMITFLSFH